MLTFFSRYYDKGDFISQRRYKGDTYAIPYAGEEVVLHWANKDQYYIKSSESFSNYAFKLDDGRMVRFRLVTADTAKDNRKDNDKERRFVLIEPHSRIVTGDDGEHDDKSNGYEEILQPVTEEGNGIGQELVLRFEYRAMPKGNPGTRQDKLVSDAVEKILNDDIAKTRWLDLSQRAPTEKNPQRTLLEKHLTQYTARNTADYFIHKNLGGFLRNELDFYIKNEVMHLDDVQHADTFATIEKNLRQIQTLRTIALDLIDFLAQLEDFQKKLWLKKKFVTATHYCITLDRVPQSLYSAIAANPQQWTQWEQLDMLVENKTDLFYQGKTGSIEYLQAHPYLMVDTALFDAAFKQQLLAQIDNLDDSLGGLLIHGDNFQALNIIKCRFTKQIGCVAIDPPYNTGNGDFHYKDSYQHSSWLSMMFDRLEQSKHLLSVDYAYFCCSGEYEQANLKKLNNLIFGEKNVLPTAYWEKVYSPRMDALALSEDHDHISISGTGACRIPFEQNDKQFTEFDSITGRKYRRRSARKEGSNSRRQDRPNLYYSVAAPNGAIVYPIRSDGSEGCWRWSQESYLAKADAGELEWIKTEAGWQLYAKQYFDENATKPPSSLWTHELAGHNHEATQLIKDMFGFKAFSTPKPPKLFELMIRISGTNTSGCTLDFFAGSGSTGHAVINLNREDNGQRKYILVEQGEYFDTVLKPRIQKVVYSANWKDGKATAPETGISHVFKVLKIESYEDALNNLQLKREDAQQILNFLPQSVQDDYLLRYMLEIESRGSLLSVEQFNKPFDYKLKVTVDSAGAYKERTIDLVETFNYLIGLRVKHIDMHLDKGFITVIGWLPSGEKTLVLWRDVERVDYDQLNRLCDKLAINPADSEFEVVYINGDHNIPAVFTSSEAEGGITKTLKIRQIEAEFLSRMFATDDV